MIDIHSHILPMIDDGASSVEMALEMLRKAYDDGTDVIILTPHVAHVYGFDNPNKKIKDEYEEFLKIYHAWIKAGSPEGEYVRWKNVKGR